MKKISVFIILLLLGFNLKSQDLIYDESNVSEVWSGFTLKKKLSKKLTLNLDDQIRINAGIKEVRVNFMEVGLKYKVYKNLSVKVQYRYSLRTNLRNTKRISFDVSNKWKIKRLKLELKYRARFQNAIVEYTGQNITYGRNQFSISYKINKKWSPYTSYESFFKFNDNKEFRSNRYNLGIEYTVNKRLSWNGFIQYDQELNVKNPVSRSVIGVLLVYKLK